MSESTHHCLNCDAPEDRAALLAVRHGGRDVWICAQCMPALIHEPQQVAEKLKAIREAGA